MRYFKKLGLHIDASVAADTGRLDLQNVFYRWQKYGLRLKRDRDYEAVANNQFRLSPEDEAAVVAKLPASLVAIESPEVWVFNGKPLTDNSPMLAPHRDLVRLCGVNVYFETHGERTIFYQYQDGDLTEEESFTATDGECYVLDVDQPHAVELVPGCTRKLMSISFIKTPYAEVVKHFQ